MGEEVALMWRMCGQVPHSVVSLDLLLVIHYSQGEEIGSLDHISPPLIIIASNPVL